MKKFLAATMFTGAIGFATTASAQSHDFNNSNRQTVGMTAGLSFKMPLGTQRYGKIEDKARFGFRLGLTDSYEIRTRPTLYNRTVDLVEIGFRLDGTPSLLMSGQDIYTPLFTTLHADEESDTTSGGENTGNSGAGTILLVLGVTAAVGAVTVIGTQEAIEDSIEDVIDSI